MSKLSLLKFVVRPGEVAAGIRRLGVKGALTHGMRRMGATFERALLGPAQLRINPMGAVCNHACGMCWLQHLPPGEKEREFRQDRESAMTLDEYRRLFDGMPAGLTEVNVVGGGEPLVHPQCVEIMREVKRHGWRGYLISNGTLLREPVARAMVDMGWDLTRLSVHAGDAATFRAIHGVDHFERLRDNLRTFDRLRREAGRERTVAMHVHHVVQRENLDAIPPMFAFAEEVGADQVVFEIVFALSPDFRMTVAELGRAADALEAGARTAKLPSNALAIAASLRAEQRDAPREPLPKPVRAPAPVPAAATTAPPTSTATATATASAPAARPATPPMPATLATPPELALAAGASVPAPAPGPNAPPAPVHVEPPYRPAARCSVGFDSALVTAQGLVVPCCFSTEVMGNVREQSFRDIWYGPTYADFRRRLIRGQFADYCSRVRCKLRSFLHD